jgi:hypothetical protein
MRWKVKPDPEVGNERFVKRFLLWPMKIGTEMRWLEWVTIYQEYNCRKAILGATACRWEDIYFKEARHGS